MTIDRNIWMISISDNPISQHWKNEVLPSWEEHYTVRQFEAVTPKDLPDLKELRFALKKMERPFTDTEKAVWYSHYMLWKKCIADGKPMIIVEHDILLHHKLIDNFKLPVNYFTQTYIESAKRYGPLPAGGYFITPSGARRLIYRATNKAIVLNVDGYIAREGQEIGSDHFGKYIAAEQLFDKDIGTTIDHGKKQ